jgi:site-specific DNA recombinase
MNGVIYCRVSSKEQVKGTSLESQELACREYAARKNIVVSKVFVEKGESAKFADRTQLLELIEFCRRRENSIQVLLVWKIDRLARNVGDHFNIKANLLKQGVEVVSVTEPIDSNPEGKLLETILAGFAQFDNDLRAVRTVQGMRRKIQEGLFPWKPPLGYKTINPPGSKKTEPDQPDQPLFGLLQRTWSEFATGAYTKAEIVRLMTGWGVRTRVGAAVSKQTLDNMLRDPFYAGIIRDPWSKEEHTGRHIPLVSPDLFARVQEVVNRRNRSIRHVRVRPEFPLRTFARCPACLHYLTGAFSRGRSKYYAYYHCFNHSCAGHTYHSSDSVHEEFKGFLDSITPDRHDIARIADSVAATSRRRHSASKALAERQKLEIERLEARDQQLIQMRMDRLITDEEFLAQKAMQSTRRLQLQATNPRKPWDESQFLSDLDEICKPLLNLAATWSEIVPPRKQRFQRLILPTGFVTGRIGTAERGCLFSTFRSSRHQKSHLVPLTGQFWNQLAGNIQEFAMLFRGGEDEELAA